MRNSLLVAASATALLATVPAQASTIYVDRATFEATLTRSFTDDFIAGYPDGFGIYDDATMSAFVGQTRFTATQNFVNLIQGDGAGYCAGCNGSFTLDFDSTSYGTAAGVFGVGVDYLSDKLPYYTAFVTYGDGTSQNIALNQSGFLGVTSTEAVRSIAFGLPNGGTTYLGSFSIDNLTIGSGATVSAVPEPATWAMMMVGFGMVAAAARRRRRVTVAYA